MFYGMSFAFDKSLSGDEDITSALLRNVYNDDKSKQKTADILGRYATRSELDYLQHLLHNMCLLQRRYFCFVQRAGVSCQDRVRTCHVRANQVFQ